MTSLHKPSCLPDRARNRQKPETLTLKLPAGLTKRGQVVVAIRREHGVNAVLGELWVTSL